MYYSYVEIKYVARSFSPARTDLALKLLTLITAISLLVMTMVLNYAEFWEGFLTLRKGPQEFIESNKSRKMVNATG